MKNFTRTCQGLYYFTVEVKREFQAQLDFVVMGVTHVQVEEAMHDAYPDANNINVKRIEDGAYDRGKQ